MRMESVAKAGALPSRRTGARSVRVNSVLTPPARDFTQRSRAANAPDVHTVARPWACRVCT